jgi:hypothetical protein
MLCGLFQSIKNPHVAGSWWVHVGRELVGLVLSPARRLKEEKCGGTSFLTLYYNLTLP